MNVLSYFCSLSLTIEAPKVCVHCILTGSGAFHPFEMGKERPTTVLMIKTNEHTPILIDQRLTDMSDRAQTIVCVMKDADRGHQIEPLDWPISK